ncbi:MAG TPA: TetR/AcrR family transcriptional regulator [Streptosporangiaceae bacterium]|nr:TetR/AcrR family transcriptional regulator [Streptosporangiaceae bacterium]
MVNASSRQSRAAQKLRTRQALMDIAVELIKAGRRPSVSTVANQAGVSRATAYRYFPSQDLMLSEAMIRAAAGTTADPPPSASTTAADPAEMAAAITRQAGQFSLNHEERLRTALRLSLDPQSGYQRPGRRGRWIEDILAAAGDRLDPPARARLRGALHLVLGIDPIIQLTDIAGLDRAEALDVLEWSAATLVQAALQASLHDEREAAEDVRVRDPGGRVRLRGR